MVQEQVKTILAKIKHFQNGDVSKSMENMGLKYGINYGVTIIQLKKIAIDYEKSNELANTLLALDIREAKILASMLFDETKTSIDLLLSIATAIDNIELVEHFSRNLFAKTDDVTATLPIIMEVGLWQQVLALYAASWAIKFKHKNIEQIIQWSKENITTLIVSSEGMLQKALLLLLQSIAQHSEALKIEMIDIAKLNIKSKNQSTVRLVNEFLLLNNN